MMTGAMQLVVHEAAVQMTWSEVSWLGLGLGLGLGLA